MSSSSQHRFVSHGITVPRATGIDPVKTGCEERMQGVNLQGNRPVMGVASGVYISNAEPRHLESEARGDRRLLPGRLRDEP